MFIVKNAQISEEGLKFLLYFAVSEKLLHLVEYLVLVKKLDINESNEQDISPFALALSYSSHMKYVNKLCTQLEISGGGMVFKAPIFCFIKLLEKNYGANIKYAKFTQRDLDQIQDRMLSCYLINRAPFTAACIRRYYPNSLFATLPRNVFNMILKIAMPKACIVR